VAPIDKRISAADLAPGSISHLSSSWKSLLKNGKLKLAARDLYCGRGFQEAKISANLLNADHWIVSAGLGLVHIDQKIPAYDLTISGTGSTSIRQKVAGSIFEASKWWTHINKGNEISAIKELVEHTPSGLIIIAMPGSYFDMITSDLQLLSPRDLKRIRIIGPTKEKVPISLQDCRMPYDERLDGKDSPLPGTRSDFPQRAAHHFAKFIWPQSKRSSAKTHSELVLRSLSTWKPPEVPKRDKKSDEEIIGLILRNWQGANGQSGRMHRLLRDDKLIACEQKRFKYLFHEAKIRAGHTN
jgi:hypothetical protein